MKKLAWLILVAVTAISAVYVFRHLVRWEWHRAMFAGLAMLAGEVALVGAVVVRAVRKATRSGPAAPRLDPRVHERIRGSRPPSERVFQWLQPQHGRLNVFVSILLGGGVVVSAGAWILDKVAKATGSGGLETRLTQQLSELRPPEGGFVVADDPLLAAGRTVPEDGLRLLLGPALDAER